MGILLSDEERHRAMIGAGKGWVNDAKAKSDPYEMCFVMCEGVAKAQIKKVVEYLKERNEAKEPDYNLIVYNWQALLKEIE